MIGVDKANGVALVEAARLSALSQSNFAEHLESLKAFYADPALHAHPQDCCTCTAPSAKKITGRVAYHGDFWLKDFRGQGLPKMMAAILHGVSLVMWTPDFLCGLAGRWTLDKGVLAQYGHTRHEPGGSILRLVEEDIVADDLLVWLTGEVLLIVTMTGPRGGNPGTSCGHLVRFQHGKCFDEESHEPDDYGLEYRGNRGCWAEL